MLILIILGACITIGALIMIVATIRTVLRARAQNDENSLKEALKRATLINMIALFASALGLAMVLVGILLS